MSIGEIARETAHRRLRITLVAGGLYDLAFAAINLAAPGFGSWLLEVPLPGEQVYLRFTGVFLIALALFYLLPAIHPRRYLGNVVVAIVARTAGAIFLIGASVVFGYPRAFLLLGAGDLLFALIHAWYLTRAEGGNPLRHYLGAGPSNGLGCVASAAPPEARSPDEGDRCGR